MDEKPILKKLEEHDKEFDSIDKKFDAIDEKLAEHDDRFDFIIKKLLDHDEQFVKIKQEISLLRNEMLRGQSEMLAILRRLDQRSAMNVNRIVGVH